MKIAGNNTVLRLVSGGYKSAYSNEVELQSRVCIDNNQLQINAKTKELILDCRKKKTDITLPPLCHFIRTQRRKTITQTTGVLLPVVLREHLNLPHWHALHRNTLAHRIVFQRTINMAQKNIGCPPPTLEDLHTHFTVS